MGTCQGWDNARTAKGGESFSSIAGFNDSRDSAFNGPG